MGGGGGGSRGDAGVGGKVHAKNSGIYQVPNWGYGQKTQKKGGEGGCKIFNFTKCTSLYTFHINSTRSQDINYWFKLLKFARKFPP